MRVPQLLAPSHVSDNSLDVSLVVGRRRGPLYHLALGCILILAERHHNIL